MNTDLAARPDELRLVGILMTVVLILAACSSTTGEQAADGDASDTDVVLEVDESADADDGGTESAEAEAAETAGELTEDECIELFLNRGPYSTIAGGLSRSASQAEAEVTLEAVDIAESRASIEMYVPFQDVVPEVFSPLREGIETLSADLDAFEAGTFNGSTGDYGVVSIAAVLAELGC